MSQYATEQIGDNIEFTAVATGDYEIFLQNNNLSSANDTEFKKYPGTQIEVGGFGLTGRKFEIRADKNIDLVGLNGIDFTNPAQITADKPHVENRNVPSIVKMKIRVPSATTMIKVRWF